MTYEIYIYVRRSSRKKAVGKELSDVSLDIKNCFVVLVAEMPFVSLFTFSDFPESVRDTIRLPFYLVIASVFLIRINNKLGI